MSRTSFIAALLIGSSLALPLHAQEAAPAATAASEDDGNEIVVTARRRAENIQDVPIAVTALNGEALESGGVLELTEVAESVPNVTLEPSRGTNSTLTAFIRGVGQQDPVAGFEAGVGIYLDDVYLNRPQAGVLDVFDVERVEVLRGPQGTLYGRNTIGGAVKYVSRRLTDDPMLKLRGTIGTQDQADLVVTASTPVADGLRAGASVARLSRGGFGSNVNTGAENYNKDVWATRGSLEADLSDKIQVRLAADYVSDQSNPRNGHRLIRGLLSGAPVLDNVFDTRAGLTIPAQDVEAYGFSGTIEAELNDSFTLKSITAYRRDRTDTPIDFDSLPAADVDVPAIYKNKQTSQELQLLYSSPKLNGLVGFYYLDANAQNIFDVILGTTVGLTGLTASTFGNVDTKTYSFFGDFTYDFTDQISLSVGGRWTSDKRAAVVLRRNLLNGPSVELGGAAPVVLATTSNFTGEKTFKQFTPRASLAYKPTDDHTLYGSYSKGFKGGGFDPRGLTTAARDFNGNGTVDASDIFDFMSFDPEKVDSYELGWKAQFFDRALTSNIAIFHADYTDVQIPGSQGIVVGGVPTFIGITTNAGKAKMDGIEWEGSVRGLDGFAGEGSYITSTWAVGYLDARYTKFIGATGADVSAQRVIQNTPKWTLSTQLTATFPVENGTLDASFGSSFRSKTSQFETRSPLDQAAYSLYDASLVWRSGDDRWTVGLYGKNLADKKYIVSGYNFMQTDPATGQLIRNATTGNPIPTLGREGVLTAFYGNPRQIFATVGLKF